MILVRIDAESVSAPPSGEDFATMAFIHWAKLLTHGLRGPLRLVVANEEERVSTIPRIVKALRSIESPPLADDADRVARNLGGPQLADGVLVVEDAGLRASSSVTDVGGVSRADADHWIERSSMIGRLISDGFDATKLGEEPHRRRNLESQIALIGAASTRVRLFDPYIWKGLVDLESSDRAKASLEFLLHAALSRNASHSVSLSVVTSGEKLGAGVQSSDLEEGADMLLESLAAVVEKVNDGGRIVREIVVHLHGFERRISHQLHGRFLESDLGGLMFDPGLESVLQESGDKWRVSDRLLVRACRSAELSLIQSRYAVEKSGDVLRSRRLV